MYTLIHRMVAVMTSLVLVLPPGWCCRPMEGNRAASEPGKSGCCHKAKPAPPTEPTETPPRRIAECCCSRDATLPEKYSPPLDTPVSSVPVVTAEPGMIEAGEPVFTVLLGPRLHLLQCVWR